MSCVVFLKTPLTIVANLEVSKITCKRTQEQDKKTRSNFRSNLEKEYINKRRRTKKVDGWDDIILTARVNFIDFRSSQSIGSSAFFLALIAKCSSCEIIQHTEPKTQNKRKKESLFYLFFFLCKKKSTTERKISFWDWPWVVEELWDGHGGTWRPSWM